MRIGFDGKRALHNTTGLGQYSRNLLAALSQYAPEHEYLLYAAGPGSFSEDFWRIRQPDSKCWQQAPALWRQFGISGQLRREGLEIFHGLSNELPRGLPSSVRGVVTVHDLIFLQRPQDYACADRQIYLLKTRHACRAATRIAAISRQTQEALIERLAVPPEKVELMYQHCHPRFLLRWSEAARLRLQEKWQIPAGSLLYVGSVTPRKNLLALLQALHSLREAPFLIVAGNSSGAYGRRAKAFVREKKLESRVRFLEGLSDEEMPGLYQSALALVYPSFVEGFGLPLLEALHSGLPVIAGHSTALREAGGPGSMYVDPELPEELAQAILRVGSDSRLRQQMIHDGERHAQQFLPQEIARRWQRLYAQLH